MGQLFLGFKRKNGGKDDNAKVYECRFCSLKFCKSQALGGHMNRHRQGKFMNSIVHKPLHFWSLFSSDYCRISLICLLFSERETETLNRARQLVFGNETLGVPGNHMRYLTILYTPTQVHN